MRMILIALSGLALVGVTFGMARYGYGLFLPQFVAVYGLDKPTQGLIGSGSYAGYLVATVLASWLSGHTGPRTPLALGAACAALGTAIVAQTPSLPLLAAGIALAGASPGMVFPALSDWVSIAAGPKQRNTLFAIMNSGTGAGVIVATPLALLPLDRFHFAWWAFALCAVVFGTVAVFNAPSGKAAKTARSFNGDTFQMTELINQRAWPLYASAGIAGFVTAIYWTFSVETITHAIPDAFGFDRPELLFWMLIGVSGFFGALTGNAVNARGLGSVLSLTMAAIATAIGLIGAFSQNLSMILLSGLIFGAAFIFITGLLGVWSMMIFRNRPSAGFGLTFLVFTLGAMLGPWLSGIATALSSQTTVFMLTAGLALLPCLATRSATQAAQAAA